MARSHILVAGAAHIDVMADYSARAEQFLDKVGGVRFSIGGTAFNIAANLGQMQCRPALMSVIKKASLASVWIRERMRSNGISDAYLDLSPRVPDSAFIAIRRDGELRNAVTASAVTQHRFAADRIDEALVDASLLVIDCNLASDQMSTFIERAQAANLEVVIAAASDTKASRIPAISDGLVVDLVSLNQAEFESVAGPLPDAIDAALAATLCARFRARRLLITLGAAGFMVLTDAGDRESFAAPEVEEQVSSTGAGDALLAAVIASRCNLGRFDFQAAYPKICDAVRRVLEQPGATIGALAGEADFAALARIAAEDSSWRDRIRTPDFMIGTAIALVGVVIGFAQLLLAASQGHSPSMEAPRRQEAPNAQLSPVTGNSPGAAAKVIAPSPSSAPGEPDVAVERTRTQ